MVCKDNIIQLYNKIEIKVIRRMINDGFVLLETNGKYVLIDNVIHSIFTVSKSFFDIFQALKNNMSMESVKGVFGEEDVQKVLDFWDRLKSDREWYAKNHEVDSQKFLASSPCIVEGVFMLAQHCNMKCKYCYGGEGQFGASGLMTREMAKRFLLLFLGLSDIDTIQKIRFLGGEPLLNFEVMKYVVEQWEELQKDYPKKRIQFAFTTNGTVFTPEIIAFIKEKKIGVTISLDGPAEVQNDNRKFCNENDTYDCVMSGIDMLEQAQVEYSVRSTLTSNTDLEVLYSYFEKRNFAQAHIIPVDYPLKKKEELYQWDIEQYRVFENKEKEILYSGYLDIVKGNTTSFQAKQMQYVYDDMNRRTPGYPFKCSAGWWSAVFSSDGYIYPCHRLVGKENYRIGDVANGLDTCKIRQIFQRVLEKSKRCESCEVFVFCKRRCIAQMECEHDESGVVSEELCEVYQDAYRIKLDLFLELKKQKKVGELQHGKSK